MGAGILMSNTKMIDFGTIDYEDNNKPSGFTFTVIGEEDEARELPQDEAAYLIGLGLRLLITEMVQDDVA